MRYEEVDPVIPAPPAGNRTPGVHLSKVLRNMAVGNKALDPGYVEDYSLIEFPGEGDEFWARLTPEARVKVALGMAWEDWYFPKLCSIVHQPGEMLLDGIYMTPDGESLDYCYSTQLRDDLIEYAVHECKVTWKSLKRIAENGLEGQFLWISQLKANCKSKGTLIGYLHVLFMRGNYKWGTDGPTPKVWRIEFTQLELNVGWDTITAYVERHSEDL